MQELELIRHPDTNEIIPEEWKPIEDFEEWYGVSNYGRVRSWRNNRWGRSGKAKMLKTPLMNTGYPHVRLYDDEGNYCKLIHRLVAEAFISNPQNKPCVNHKDGDKTNPFYLNLEWCTYSENDAHARKSGLLDTRGEKCGGSKLTKDEVLEIRSLYPDQGYTQQELADKFGICIAHVNRIIHKRRWQHI